MASPAGLNEWHIAKTGHVTAQPISSGIILISLPFNASNREHGALVFQDDCITPFDNDMYFEVGTTAPSSDVSGRFIQFNTTLEMNLDALMISDHWTPFADKSRSGGWVEACVETYLAFTDNLNLGNEDSWEKVDFKNDLLNISVSLTADFKLDRLMLQGEGDLFVLADFSIANNCKGSSLGCIDEGNSSQYVPHFTSIGGLLMVLLGILIVAGYFMKRNNDRLNRVNRQFESLSTEERAQFPLRELSEENIEDKQINKATILDAI